MRPRGLVFALALVLVDFGSFACRREAPLAEPEPTQSNEPTAREPAATTEPAIWLDLPAPDRAPDRVVTPTELCDHVTTILSEATQLSGQDAEQFRGECIEEANGDVATLGAEQFQTQATCMMAAKDMPGLDACDGAMNTTSDPEAEAMCKHMLGVLFAELGSPPSADIDAQMAEQPCVTGIVQTRATMTPDEFARVRECVLGAKTLSELERCDTP